MGMRPRESIALAVVGGAGFWLAQTICCARQPKEPAARAGAQAVRHAAEVYDARGNGKPCPTVDDLVDAKKLAPKKRDDPWGRFYRIVCDGEGIHVISDGKDGRPYSGDEVSDSFEDEHLERLAGR